MRFLAVGVIVFSATAAASLWAAAAPSGEEILRMVRMSQAMQNLPPLTGKLRDDKSGDKHGFRLTLGDGMIRFVFADPNEAIHLDLAESGARLRRAVAGSSAVVPDGEYGKAVRGTAINYEDLSMRFLYWPKPQVFGSDKVSVMTCWVVRVVNPDRRGPYRTVDVWVDQNSAAIAKMEAYDWNNKKVKSFVVTKGQKHGDAWILKQMRVEARSPETEKVVSRTYMEIDDPEK